MFILCHPWRERKQYSLASWQVRACSFDWRWRSVPAEAPTCSTKTYKRCCNSLGEWAFIRRVVPWSIRGTPLESIPRPTAQRGPIVFFFARTRHQNHPRAIGSKTWIITCVYRQIRDQGNGWIDFEALRMRLYLRQAWRFLEIMLTLIHLCSGQPARATEIETMTIRNGPNTARSVFLFQEHIMTVIAYNKTTSLTGHERFIARFLPKAQSKTLAVYLVVVRYFER